MFQYQAIQTGQVTVTGTATQIVPAYSSRSGINIVNTGTTDVYIGENANVTITTGHLLPGTKGASVSFSTTGAVYGITSGASQVVTFLETN
jgi:hypothetical protein